SRWGQEANEWSDKLEANALIRTYEGYGGYNPDGTPMSIGDALAGGFIVQTGLWLVDDSRPETTGMLTLKCRDAGKLVVEEPIFPPLVRPVSQGGVYPLNYMRFQPVEVDTPYVAYGNAAG